VDTNVVQANNAMSYQEPFAVYHPMTGERIQSHAPRPACADDMEPTTHNDARDQMMHLIHALGHYAMRAPVRYAVLAYYMANPCQSRSKAAAVIGSTKQAVQKHVACIKREHPSLAGILGLKRHQAMAQQQRRGAQ
jgi:hypothetical protein